MHYYSPNLGGHGLYLLYNVVGWIFISIIIGLGFWEINLKGNVRLTSFAYYLWFGFFLLLIPLIYPNNELVSWTYPRIFGVLGGILFYSSLLQFKLSKNEQYRILYIILCGILIESILGIFQYYLMEPDNWMGYDVSKNFPYGIFQQRNVMGIFMVTGLAISFFLIHNTFFL